VDSDDGGVEVEWRAFGGAGGSQGVEEATEGLTGHRQRRLWNEAAALPGIDPADTIGGARWATESVVVETSVSVRRDLGPWGAMRNRRIVEGGSKGAAP
jgi:hypothetical protein